jgi:hypothetical protein
MPTAGAQPETVALTVDALPTGVTGTFASPSIQSNAATMLTLTVAPTMAPGSYTFNVTGKAANGAHHSIGGMLTVTASSGGGEGGGAGNGTGSGNGTGGNGSGGGTGGNGNGDTGSGAGARGGGCSMSGVGGRASDGPLGDGPLARFVLALAALALVPKLLRAATRRRRRVA